MERARRPGGRLLPYRGLFLGAALDRAAGRWDMPCAPIWLSCHALRARLSACTTCCWTARVDYASRSRNASAPAWTPGIERNVLIESISAMAVVRPATSTTTRATTSAEEVLCRRTGGTVPRVWSAPTSTHLRPLIDAVASGIGRAVVLVHLLGPDPRARGARLPSLRRAVVFLTTTGSRTTPACSGCRSTRSRANAAPCCAPTAGSCASTAPSPTTLVGANRRRLRAQRRRWHLRPAPPPDHRCPGGTPDAGCARLLALLLLALAASAGWLVFTRQPGAHRRRGPWPASPHPSH